MTSVFCYVCPVLLPALVSAGSGLSGPQTCRSVFGYRDADRIPNEDRVNADPFPESNLHPCGPGEIVSGMGDTWMYGSDGTAYVTRFILCCTPSPLYVTAESVDEGEKSTAKIEAHDQVAPHAKLEKLVEQLNGRLNDERANTLGTFAAGTAIGAVLGSAVTLLVTILMSKWQSAAGPVRERFLAA